MAPRRGESIERNDEYEKFLRTLEAYHEKRGTSFDPAPKVGVRHIDLLKLYNRVIGEGGYDLVSDTKAKPLCWRKFAEEFVGKNVYSAAQAFQVKQIYYKTLVAYEISEYWKEEPPPKEILEDVTAKGGNVRGRTLENFVRPLGKEEKLLEGSPETPKQEKMEVDDPGSAAGRTTRGLRQQPPQRVLFQPETNAARQTRGSAAAAMSPGTNGMMNGMTNGASSTLASYEPSQSYPLSLKPVVTPANNPDHFRNERKRKLEAMAAGTGFIGPNIYVRAQMALQSGIPDEERYALHHLVKISHERGDKYRFDQFPGLAEALSRKILCASSLFYDVAWDVNYDDDRLVPDDETLDGLQDTANVLKNLKERPLLIANDDVLDGAFLDHMNRITEAGLVFRNMCTMDENARYASTSALTRDMIAITISLPDHWILTELRLYMLEIAEMVLKHCDVSTQSDLYTSLLAQLKNKDRGTVITAMKVISRVSMLLPPPKQLEMVEPETLQNIQNWLLVEDEELRGACLDFLMQYTTFANNVETLLQAVDGETLARQLGRLLLFNAKDTTPRIPSQKPQIESIIPPVPKLSKGIVEKLLTLDEPERSSEWLRICFLADPNSEMTQISLWQAYQGTFNQYQATHGNLIAGEFIKNVSAVFTGATAQVAGQNKYVIRGIRSRKVPIETGVLKTGVVGRELTKCHWTVEHSVPGIKDPETGIESPATTRIAECGEWFRDTPDLFKHILSSHLHVPEKISKPETNGDAMDIDIKAVVSDGSSEEVATGAETFDFAAGDKTVRQCRWATCQRNSTDFSVGKLSTTAMFARHVKTHLPHQDRKTSKYNIKWDDRRRASAIEPLQLSILVDQTDDAAGLPLSAALVLSHIARFMPGNSIVTKSDGETTEDAEKSQATAPAEKLIEKIFGNEVKERMFFALAHCPPARTHVGNILRNIRRSAGHGFVDTEESACPAPSTARSHTDTAETQPSFQPPHHVDILHSSNADIPYDNMASGKVTFQIRKYSWSYASTGNNKANYRHISGDNIFLILEGEQHPRGSLHLRIVQGTKILNDVDLAKHIDISISTKETFLRVDRQVTGKQLPTYCVAAGPKLAITYRPVDDLPHRMQVEMQIPEDATKIVNFLKYRGMPFVEASHRHTKRPSTTDSDLHSINTNMTFFSANERSVPAYNLRSAGTTRSQDRIPNEQYQRSYNQSYTQTPLRSDAPPAPSSDFFLVRNERTAPRTIALEQPSTARVFSRNTHIEIPSTSSGRDGSNLDSGLSHRSQTSHHPEHASASRSDVFNISSDHMRDTSSPQRNRIESPQTTSSTSLLPDANATGLPQSISSTSLRTSRSIEDLLPPPRELPFDTARKERSRSSSVLSLTALPKPQMKKAGSTLSERSNIRSVVDDPVVRPKRPRIELDLGVADVDESPNKRAHHGSMPPPPLRPSSGNVTSSPKTMNELLYGKQPRESQIPSHKPLPGLIAEQSFPAALAANDTTPQGVRASSDIISSIEKVAQSTEALNLAEYAKLNHNERARLLEQFMVDMLGNKDFATLCEDMSVCWQRLAHGL